MDGEQSGDTANRAQILWTKIKTAGRQEFGQATEDYWYSVVPSLTESFLELTAGEMPEDDIQYFVSQFGKGDTETGFRWVITPWLSGCGPHVGHGPIDAKKDQHRRTVQCLLAKHQVQLFLKDRKLLERYYRAVVWYGKFFDAPPVRATIDGIRAEEPEAYWWFARNAILFIHATERDDLLKDAAPEKLDEVFEKWLTWYRKEGSYLRTRKNGLTWYLDTGAKERGEGYIPFFANGEPPPLGVGVTQPFTDQGFRVPTARFFRAID